MVSPKLLKMLMDQKLAEMASGIAPDGFEICENLENRKVYKSLDGSLFGIDCRVLYLETVFNGCTIILKHGEKN